jgi:endonuclease YncB( thermonuclease family)
MHTYHVVIKRIVDGDTVDVDIDLGFNMWILNERIRLSGIDAPEERTSDSEEKIFGQYATKYVEDRLPVGSKAVYRSEEFQAEKYGRSLGDFLIYDGLEDAEVPLTEVMIRDNVAVRYTSDDKALMEQKHAENRKILRDKGLVG